MAFRFCDSFDHYATAEINLKWTQMFGCSISTAQQRTGPNSMFFESGLLNPALASITLDYQTVWTVGFALFIPTNASGLSNGGAIYQLVNCGTTLMNLFLQDDFTFTVNIGNSLTSYGGPSSASIHMGVWYYIECQNTLSSVTIGSNTFVTTTTIVRLNGVQILAPPSQNLNININSLITGAANANRHIFSGIQGSPNGAYMDDLYITDGQTSGNNSFLGDVSISALYPDADASPLDFSIFPATPTTHYTKINEEPPDGDTTYIYDNNPGATPPTTGDKDDWDWQPVSSFVGTIPAVHYLLYARKDDAGSRGICHTIGNSQLPPGTGGVLGTPIFSLPMDYVYCRIPLDTNASGSAWTVSNFNSQDFGVQISE